VGLLRKLEAYALQDEGYDTVDSNVRLGLPVDSRSYASAARMLRSLGVSSMRLLTNNPAKCSGLERYGLRVNAMVPLTIEPNSENFAYLLAKRDRLGHRLSNLPAPANEASQLMTHGTSDECRPIVGEAAA
jgi:3,4-dihydroxy 2-butanone 4-phosphate synthase/GTP cyclohydrolase II